MARQQFPFYKSFDDVAEDLTDVQLAKYIRVLLDVQFLRIKIDDVVFKDKTLSIVWKSQKHSINKSVNGFLDGQKRETVKNPYFGVHDDSYVVPSEGIQEGIQTPTLQGKEECKEQGKGKGKGKGKEQVKGEVAVCEKPLAEKTIDYLNLKAKKNFTYTKGNLREINSQIKKGFGEQEFAYVIDIKIAEWSSNPEMNKNINPVTLFRDANFDRYLNQSKKPVDKIDDMYSSGLSATDVIKEMERRYES